jgi:hypothetical protein
MAQPKKKPKLAQVLKLVEQLSPEELLELRLELDARMSGLTWATVNLQNAEERAAFFKQEEAKADKRITLAFEKLQAQGILNERGDLVKPGLPADMQPGSGCDVGG